MFDEVVDAAVSARPFVPSAMQPTSVQPEGSTGRLATKLGGVAAFGHVAAVPVGMRTGLQPGSWVRGPSTFSSTISESSVQAEAWFELM